MYAGYIVEEGKAESVYENPLHPYVKGLIGSVLSVDRYVDRLSSIPGSVPDLLNLPKGCRFQPRCSICIEKCNSVEPELLEVEPEHRVRCWCVNSR